MSVVLLLLGGMAAWYLHRLQKDSSALLSASVVKVQAAEELEIISHELRNELNRLLFLRDRRSVSAVSDLHQEAIGWIGKAQQLADTEDENGKRRK